MRPPEALGRKAQSSLFSRASLANRSWLSFRCATSGSPSMTLLAGSVRPRWRAARNAATARHAAVTASGDAAQARMAIRVSENLKRRMEEQVAVAEKALASAVSDKQKERATEARAKAAARVEELQAKLAAANAELQPKLNALAAARAFADTAAAAPIAAVQAARGLTRALQPVSVFISRKTQHLYVRRAFQPILEIPVPIQA